MNKVNILLGIGLGLYAIFAIIPLAKSIIYSIRNRKKEEKWVEEPMMIGE